MLEEDKNSPIYPYNAYLKPSSLLVPGRRVQIPALLPRGLGVDAYAMKKERERFLEKRMENRLEELHRFHQAPPGPGKLQRAYIGTMLGQAGVEIKLLIEKKALLLREKQRKLRSDLVQVTQVATALPGTTCLDKDMFRRPKRVDLSQVRALEKLERKQRHQREGRVRAAHRQELELICGHGRELSMQDELARQKQKRFGQKIQQYHQIAEKEEQKRVERISKERLKALKNDDEEAYLKLIDTAKDTRITHLLKQTDQYLDNLASMVRAQQNDDEGVDLVLETGPTSEATFGATRQDDPTEDTGKIDYYAVAHSISERVTEQPKILTGGKLKEYQIKGLQWMVSLYNNRLNGILADEMGLGKTIQTISLVTFLIEKKKQQGPYLIIVPLSTITNWSLEFDKWAPSVKLIVFKGPPNQRKMLSSQVRQGNFQVLLTTYEYIIKDRAALCRPKWVHMIIDEGHRLKNVQSKLSQTLMQFYVSRYRLILTGTPLQNNLPELWALLNFVLPKIFNSVKSFDEWFNMPFANTGSQDKIELNEEEQLLIIRRLHKVLRPFLLRRLKKDVESELPDKVEKVIKCKMSSLQMKLYNQMKSEGILYSEKTDAKGRQLGIKGLSNAIMQLRKLCNHPFVFDEVERAINPAGVTDDNIWRTAGKFELLDRILPKLLTHGHRMLIFFQMTAIMDIFEDFMRLKGYKYLRLDGATKQEDRSSMLQVFNAPDSPYDTFLLSTRAGGLGLNLQTADTVIIFDSDWNPHADLQAQDRAHRIGQKKAVCILRLITSHSFEEEILDRARGKLDIDGKVIQAGRFDNKSTQEERERFLRSMLEHDNEQVEEQGDMTDDEINEILARSAEELEAFRIMDIEREREAEKAWRARGGQGPKPERLMQEAELPEIYRRERVPQTLLEETEVLQAEGRGARVRNPVKYDETEEFNEWLDDNGDSDFEDWRDKRDAKEAKKKKKKGERSITDTPIPDDDPPLIKKGKGRPPKKRQQEDWQPVAPASGKRKRGEKELATPGDDEDDSRDVCQKRRKTAMSPQMASRMKAVFQECYLAVAACTDDGGRKRCELFREPPSRKLYPDYYTIIPNVIAMSAIRKRMNSGGYSTVAEFRADWRLMFTNARTYNQEGSFVYVDAVALEGVFNTVYNK
ncbi:hypothetical protein DACRYDRAFT_56374 [Dacryopinax primogenitus]|uniref:SNF2-family ATP dependent chromatin remodeling factor snf21 n=1 Tax=Dacryopinax primogenitus (strain DJM 731) TaxID=1858805 RepID=M5FSQ3_DACPD|nr:uncharacterized protein DACRYDRAFT_56374 [Dacryopinax primogenitus]EJT98968.1 hypothetical protein DACRYDRAFT_56374 [Dacryopinax primogenitus]